MSEHETTDYGRQFYEWTDQAASTAAEIVVPGVLEMVDVSSVVDVGCGTGAWLRAFVDRGVTDVLGIDSDRVPPDLLRIDRDRYLVADLTQPPEVGRGFDLAVSVEVAEHLPEEAAERFVAFLCSLAPVLLFSAAIPGQEGEAHLNEQWPSYWSDRFAVHGFEAVDVVRPLIWDNEEVPWFYRQNLLVYVRSTDPGRSQDRRRGAQTALTADGLGSSRHVHVIPTAAGTQTRNAAVVQRSRPGPPGCVPASGRAPSPLSD